MLYITPLISPLPDVCITVFPELTNLNAIVGLTSANLVITSSI